jgi:hypothetical protein
MTMTTSILEDLSLLEQGPLSVGGEAPASIRERGILPINMATWLVASALGF